MELTSQLARRAGGTRARASRTTASALLLGLGAIGGAQAATLTCDAPVRVNTANKAQWSTDARYVAAPNGIATIVDDYKWGGWLDLSTNPTHPASPARSLAGQALQGKWLSFGATADETTPGQYPAVNTKGVVADGAWVANRATFIYNEPIIIAANVDLSTIRIEGSGSADNDAWLAVRAHTLPGGVQNSGTPTTPPWTQTTTLLGGSWTALAAINLDASSSGFYYGGNTIGLALNSEATTATLPTGIVADFEISADCLTPVPPPPTAALICPTGNAEGDTVRIGPFYTSARDWTWSWRTNAAGDALENVTQPLFDDYLFRSYFRPNNLPTTPTDQSTFARWISPGTVNPAGADVPGVPYPLATGQSKSGFYGSVFTMDQPVTIGNNVDLAQIKLDGRFGFDDTGDSVFVQPAGDPAPTTFTHLLPDGYTSFTTYTTAPVPGFKPGLNSIGLVLNGGQTTNDCAGGTCAMGAIAEFYVTGVCTGEAPVAVAQIITFSPQPSPVNLSDGAFDLAPPATASSGLPVTYSSLTPAVCSVDANTGKVTPVAVGECQIAADQGGGTNDDGITYDPATRVTRSITIQAAGPGGAIAPIPTLDIAGLGLLGLLGAGLGALGLRRRKRAV